MSRNWDGLFSSLGAIFFAGMVGLSAGTGRIAASLFFELLVVWFYAMVIFFIWERKKQTTLEGDRWLR